MKRNLTMRKMHACVLPLAGLLLAGAPVYSHAIEFNQMQAAKSKLVFGYQEMGVALEGNFKQFTTRMTFDPDKPTAAQAQFDIQIASIDTGSDAANEDVFGKEWFNTKAYPTAQFVSTGVKALGGNRYEVSGKLTLKGRTRDVAAPFTFKQEGNTGIFDGAFTLKRLDYGIGEGSWVDTSVVANDVQIKFHLVADAASAKK